MKLSEAAKRMILVVCISLVVLIAGSIAFYRSMEFLPFALGAVLGVATNIVKIVMLERAVNNAVGMETKKAENYLRMQYFLRYIITGAVLAAAILLPPFNIWGAALGIFTLPIAALFAKNIQ